MQPILKKNEEKLNSIDKSGLKCTTIQIQGTSGFNFEISNPSEQVQIDKMTILITGADNGNSNPILIALRHKKNDSSNTANYENISGNKTITRKVNKYHINADQYSRYCIYHPSYYTIYITEGAL